jgi:succinyl-CoA synthetase beta subunit
MLASACYLIHSRQHVTSKHEAHHQLLVSAALCPQPHSKLRSEGGTSFKDEDKRFTVKIFKIPMDIRVGITDEQAQQMARGLAVTRDVNATADQIKCLYHTQLFASSDCSMVEVPYLHSG